MLSSDTDWPILSRKGKKKILRWSSHLFSLEQIDLHSFSSNDNLSSLTLNTRKKTVGRQSQYQMTGQANHRKKRVHHGQRSQEWEDQLPWCCCVAVGAVCAQRSQLPPPSTQPGSCLQLPAWLTMGFKKGGKVLLVWQELNRGYKHYLIAKYFN